MKAQMTFHIIDVQITHSEQVSTMPLVDAMVTVQTRMYDCEWLIVYHTLTSEFRVKSILSQGNQVSLGADAMAQVALAFTMWWNHLCQHDHPDCIKILNSLLEMYSAYHRKAEALTLRMFDSTITQTRDDVGFETWRELQENALSQDYRKLQQMHKEFMVLHERIVEDLKQ